MTDNKIVSLFNKKLQVINIGLESFGENLKQENTPVIQIEWSPPAGGDAEMASILDMLDD